METQVPGDITALTDDELRALEEALVGEFDGLVDSGSQDITALSEIADKVDMVRAEMLDRETRAMEAAEALKALAERIHGGSDMGDDDGATVEIEVSSEEEMGAEPVEFAADETAAVVDEPITLAVEINTPAEATAEAPAQEDHTVTASVRRPSAAAVRQHAPSTDAPAPKAEVVITAAADIPGLVAGQNVGLLDVAKAMHAKARTLSNGSPRVPIASISTNIPESNRLGSDLSYNLEVLDRVRDPKSLVASGGWCAPSQNIYDLLAIDGGDGLIDLPTVQVTRGGLNVPDFIGISEATNALWTWTEATDENPGELTKACLQIPCPSYTDYRLIAEGLCLTAGNLTDRAFPELTQRFIQLAINAHLHRLSGAIVNSIQSTSVAFAPTAITPTDALGNVLYALEAARNDFLSKFLMPVNSVLEVIVPVWSRSMIRAEIAMRQGIDAFGVTDAQIDEYFRVRGLRVQYLHDWQPWSTGVGADTDWPANFKALVYPAGGFVRGDGGTIDLGVVRDSVLNATNDFTAAWTEQLYLVAQMGPNAYEIEVPLFDGGGGYTGCCPAAAPVA